MRQRTSCIRQDKAQQRSARGRQQPHLQGVDEHRPQVRPVVGVEVAGKYVMLSRVYQGVSPSARKPLDVPRYKGKITKINRKSPTKSRPIISTGSRPIRANSGNACAGRRGSWPGTGVRRGTLGAPQRGQQAVGWLQANQPPQPLVTSDRWRPRFRS